MTDTFKTIQSKLPKISPSPERLQGIMISRVVLVTVFLSGALFLNINAITIWTNPRNITLIALVVVTYLLTIVYALWFKRSTNLNTLAVIQVGFDLLTAFLLVLSTGGMRGSVFLFTMALPIIAAALVLGRAAALISASIVSTMLLFLALMAIGFIHNPYDEQRIVVQSIAYIQRILLEGGIQVVMAYTLAGISGQLSKQLGEVKNELAQQEVDIKELRVLNENILASLNSGLLTVTNDNLIIFFNAAAENITGKQANKLFGNALDKIFPAIAKHITEPNTMDTLNMERRFEEIYQHPDGRDITLGFSASMLRNANNEIIGQIIIFQDLTAIKQLEYQAKRSEHLAAIGQLSAAIAHEIRNPLAAISGSVEMLQMMMELDEDNDTLMQIIVREVERLNGLITEFLEYSRPRPLKLELLVLQDLVEEVLQLFRNKAKDIEISFDPPVDLAEQELLMDREAIHQVLWNLLNNAQEAMSENDDAQEKKIVIYILQERIEDKKHIVLHIEDNGPGISAAMRDKIFEPFFTTKTQGTGLGLATLFRLIENHGGICRCGPPNILDGARFTIALPRNTVPFSLSEATID